MRSKFGWLASVSTFLLLLSVSMLQAQPVFSQQRQTLAAATPQKPLTANERIRENWRNRLNENILTLVSGNPNGTYLTIAYDISVAVNNGDELRVLPVINSGAVQNLKDILFLKGVDMGIVNTVTLRHFKNNNELGTNLDQQITYISMLFQDEWHILARPEINSLKDLEGKRVNFSDKNSGAQLVAQKAFAALKLNVKEFNMGQADAIEAMKRGELDATTCACLKPLKPYETVPENLGFKLISVPYDTAFMEDYLPARLTHEDYPNLIPEGSVVDTIAVPTLLAAYNWPKGTDRYRRIEKFINAFFSDFDKLKKPPRHPRWQTVNFAATLEGWKRFPAAQEWIDAHSQPVTTGSTTEKMDDKTKAAFEDFLVHYSKSTGKKISPEKREALFVQFSKWWSQSQ
jgi:uncharacterized protein